MAWPEEFIKEVGALICDVDVEIVFYVFVPVRDHKADRKLALLVQNVHLLLIFVTHLEHDFRILPRGTVAQQMVLHRIQDQIGMFCVKIDPLRQVALFLLHHQTVMHFVARVNVHEERV